MAGFAARVAAGDAAVATTGSADEGGEACVSWRAPAAVVSPGSVAARVPQPLTSPLLALPHAGVICGCGPAV